MLRLYRLAYGKLAIASCLALLLVVLARSAAPCEGQAVSAHLIPIGCNSSAELPSVSLFNQLSHTPIKTQFEQHVSNGRRVIIDFSVAQGSYFAKLVTRECQATIAFSILDGYVRHIPVILSPKTQVSNDEDIDIGV